MSLSNAERILESHLVFSSETEIQEEQEVQKRENLAVLPPLAGIDIIHASENFESKLKLGLSMDQVDDWVQDTHRIVELRGEDSLLPFRRAEWEFLENFEDEILYEDDSLLVINKPAGLISEASGTGKINAQDIARYMRREDIVAAHRLDRPTSGVMTLVKNKSALGGMSVQFSNKEGSNMDKRYKAVVEGSPAKLSPLAVHIPLLQDGSKMKIVAPEEYNRDAKNSITYFMPVQTFETQKGTRSLIDVKIITGRKHQIRVVAAQLLETPIVGDYLYDPNYDKTAPRTMLHATSLSFAHPILGQHMEFKAPVPQDFKEVIKSK